MACMTHFNFGIRFDINTNQDLYFYKSKITNHEQKGEISSKEKDLSERTD